METDGNRIVWMGCVTISTQNRAITHPNNDIEDEKYQLLLSCVWIVSALR
jgi:uncharacterized RmlC-like cupin family protein